MEINDIDLGAIENAKSHAAFGDGGWLTFYLCGDPSRHDQMKPHLEDLGARNLGGNEVGFIYAKVPVDLSVNDIKEKIASVRQIADEAGIEIDVIDLDSSEDVEQSKFFSLWHEG